MPSASAASSTPRATAAAPSPRFSSGKASSARTVPSTTWVSGSWNSVPATAASRAGPCSRVSRPPTSTRPANVAAVEVRHEAARRAQQRRLARARQRRRGRRTRPARRSATRRAAPARRARVGVGHAARARARSRLDPPAVGERRERTTASAPASGSSPAPSGACSARVGVERRHAGDARRDDERDERARRGGERQVVARPRRARRGRRAARGAVAADLERRGDVDRAVQRAGGHRAQHGDCAAPAPRPAALRVGHAPRVAQQDGHEPRGQRRGQRRAQGDAAEQAQQLVGVDGGGEERDSRG